MELSVMEELAVSAEDVAVDRLLIGVHVMNGVVSIILWATRIWW
jgi:hypothetical protein